MAFAAAGAKLLVDSFTGAVAPPSNVYVALCSASNGTEIAAGNSYDRITVASGSTNWNAASTADPSLATNKVDFAFPASTGAWNGGSAISYAALYDSATVGAGNLICVITLTSPVTVSATGQTVKFLAGNLTISIT